MEFHELLYFLPRKLEKMESISDKILLYLLEIIILHVYMNVHVLRLQMLKYTLNVLKYPFAS